MVSIDESLENIESGIDILVTARDIAERKLKRALGILAELEAYCGERAEGGHGEDGTQGNDWNTAWRMTQAYADGDVPYAPQHTDCERKHRAAIDRAVTAEENERVLRVFVQRILTEVAFLPNNLLVRGRDLLCRPGRHAGPYHVEVNPNAD